MRNTISNLLTPKGRWLPTLLLLFTLGIGQMWGAAETIVSITDLGSQGKSDIKVNKADGHVNLTVETHCGAMSGCTATFDNHKGGDGEETAFVKNKGGMKFGSNAHIFTVTMTSPLKLEAGDVIAFDAGPFAITTEVCNNSSNTPKAYYEMDPKKAVASGTTTDDKTYEVTPFDLIVGESSFKIGRNMGSGVTVKSFTITRTKYAVTFNNGGHGTAPSNGNFATVTLAQIPNADGMENDYWTANVDVKVWTADGKVDKTAGTPLYEDDIVIIPAATTLTAHWVTAATTYDITFNNGGHGTAPDAINASKVTLAELSAEGYLHKGWVANKAVTVDENPVAAGTLIANGKTAHVSEATEFTAQWATVWTVTYYDGATSLGTEIVENGNAPAEYAAKQTKTLASFVSWYSDAQLNTPIADISALTITANTPIYGKWDKAYAESIDMEQFVIDNKKSGNWKAYLDAANIAYSADGLSLDSLDSSKGNNNYPYLGLKFNKNKTADLYVTGNLKAGKLMIVKVGNISSTHMDIDGVTQTTPAIVGGTDTEPACTYWYYNADKEFKLVKTNSSTASVLKAIVITDPYVVTYNANGGDPVSPATFYGTALILPDAENGTASFLGWFDAETGGNKIGEAGDSYIPTASIELFAHWESISTDARLASITFSSAAGTLEPAFDPDVVNYTYTMPYPTASIPTITGATAVNANAKAPVIDAQAANWGDVAHIHGVAQSDDTKDYYITMQLAPKDGVCLVWADATGNSAMTVDAGKSLFAATAAASNTKNTATYGGKTGYKFNSRPANMSVTLSEETFQKNDVVEVFVTQLEGADKLRVFTSNDDAAMLKEEGNALQLGVNKLTLPTTSTASLYLRRSSEGGTYEGWNPYVAYIAVYRPMNPVLTAITINGRDGEIDALDDKHFTVTIPNDANLASLTVVPTIVRNAPHATTPEQVMTNSGAWVLTEDGNNTYRIMDKDGDYTDYTITLVRDVLKHTVRFMDGTSEFASALVADGESPVAPSTDPTKEDYLFQGWAETVDGDVITDWSTISISAAKDFYAKWVSDGAIKLIVDGTSGKELNTTDYITGVTIQTDATGGVKLAGTVSDVNSVKDLTRVIAYNAKSSKTKIQIKAYNTNSSDRTFVVKGLVEGADAAVQLASITLGNKETKTTDWIEFNNDDAKNRTIYIFSSSSASDIRFLQVKVIDDGATATKKAGEAGYSLNFNKGRFFGLKETTAQFEGMSVDIASSDCQPLSSSVVKVKEASMSFTAAAPVLLKVTTANNKTYYVANSTTGTTNETAKTGESEFNLAAGTWFINAGASEVQFTNIAFELPKAATPVIETQPATNHTFDSGDMTATVVATVSEGTLHYQWYKKATVGDDEEVGIDAATLTTTTEGTYYVVVTNVLAGHQNTSVTSDEAELGYRVTNDATLMALSYGGTAITLEDGVYTYDVELAKGTTDVPALAATATMGGYANVTIDNATEFVSYAASSTVTVKSEDLTVTKVYTVNFTVKHDLPQVDVTASTVWDMNNVSADPIELTGSDKNARLLLANIDGVNNTTFNAQALMFEGQHIGRTDAGIKHLAGRYVQFNVTVPGAVFVTFESNGNNARTISINGKKCARTTSGTAADDYITYALAVEPGSVEIIGYEGESANQYVRISKIEFTAADESRANLQLGGIGTVCLPFDVATTDRFGGTFYKADYQGPGFAYFIEETGTLEAGRPYVYVADTTFIVLLQDVNANTVTDPTPYRGMYGTFTDMAAGSLTDKYVIAQKKLRRCGAGATLAAYRAYIDLTEMPTTPLEVNDPANAPIRRRLGIGGNNGSTTDLQNYFEFDAEGTQKVIMNGQLYILRDGKMYNAQGQLMK